jgi:hypothetical protein
VCIAVMTKDGHYWEWSVKVEDRLVAEDLDRYIREGVARGTDAEDAQDRKKMALTRSYVSFD